MSGLVTTPREASNEAWSFWATHGVEHASAASRAAEMVYSVAADVGGKLGEEDIEALHELVEERFDFGHDDVLSHAFVPAKVVELCMGEVDVIPDQDAPEIRQELLARFADLMTQQVRQGEQ